MKNARSALVFVASSFTAGAALAASVTMLQFGSFESRADAEKRLDQIQSKYKAQLGGISAAVRETKLPPDNLIVYRTQAGPVADRAAAQKICSKLASGGDECYIVQTAMVGAGDTFANMETGNTPKVDDVSVAPVASSIPAKQSMAARVSQEPAAGALPPASLLLEANPQMSEASSVPAPAPASSPEQPALSALSQLPARDPSNMQALASVSGVTGNVASIPIVEPVLSTSSDTLSPVPALPLAPEMEATQTLSPEITQALDKAVADQDKTSENLLTSIHEDAPQSTASTRSFWDRLNPFSSEEEAPRIVKSSEVPATQPPMAVAEAAPTEIEVARAAQPIAAVERAAMSVSPEAVPAVVPAIPRAMSSLSALPEPMLMEEKRPVTSALEMNAATKPEAATAGTPPMPDRSPIMIPVAPAPIESQSAMQLLPPPEPLKARDRDQLLAMQAGSAAAPVETGSATPAPLAPLPPANSQSPITLVRPAPQVMNAPIALPSAIASQPVTSSVATPVATNVPPAIPQAQTMAALSPSATSGQRTVWAQVGPFADNDTALAFWRQFRQQNPDFPVVRVRVASPYQTGNTVPESWLRVGPVTNPAFINGLCGRLAESNLGCSVVSDIGVATSSNASTGSRYTR